MTADCLGGVWPYALELAAGLGAGGIETILATMGRRPDADQRRAAAKIESLTLAESDFDLEWMDNPWDGVARAGEWLLGLEQRHAPELVHLNGYAHGALPWRAPVLVVAHSCVYSWFAAVKGVTPPPHWERYRAAVARGIEGSDWLVAPTHAMLRSLDAYYGSGPRRSAIYNGRELPGRRVATKEPIVFSAGRLWDEAKNIELLARAAHGLRWPVYVAGDRRSPNGRALEFSNLNCLGRVDPATLEGWLGRARIFALPARYEPFGLSTLEAALSGCALVLGNIATLREVWGDAAVFVDPDDDEALRDAIDRLMRDDGLREVCVRRATRRAREFTPGRMVASYLELYKKLMADGRGRSGLARAGAGARRFSP